MASYNNTTIKKMNYNGQKVKKWYHDGVKVFSAGNVVTYYFNPTDYAQEEVDSEASVLSPKTVNYLNHFSGWTFVGWREDKTASSSVLSSKVMGDEPITLYAVYKRTLTAYFNGNGATSGSVASISGTQYYNNSNVVNPTITLPACGYARTNYKFTGWNYGAVGAKIQLTSDITISAQWQQTRVYIVQNSSPCSGVSMVVGQVNHSDRYNWSYSGSSITLNGDGDDEYEQDAYIYFNKQIPAGKTVHYTLNATNVNSYYHLWKTSYYAFRVISHIHDTRRDLTDFISLSNGDNDTNTTSNAVTIDTNSYLGFYLNPSYYGGSDRKIRFTIVEIYYDL